MTKQTTTWAAFGALVLAIVALILQSVFASTGHASRALAAEIAWPVLLVICVGLFFWGRRLKS
jgi:di/tricarboxylate transporter